MQKQTDANETPCDGRRAMRQSAIVIGAAQLFAKLGYSDCEMERVAQKLKIAKGTLYLYFAGKRELFFACVDEAMNQLQQAVQEAAMTTSDPFEQISRAIRAYLRFFHEHPHYVELLIQERAIFRDRKRPTYFEHRERARAYWRELYAGLIASGRIRGDQPVEAILDVIGNLLYGTMFTNHFLGGIDIDAQHRWLLDVLLFGLLTESERSHQRARPVDSE